ncbi:hypothetical protein N9E28_02835 [Alphaproteobacteria bacterium]|nr:hypothetical protein [Alphaproteobacteria bacterium]
MNNPLDRAAIIVGLEDRQGWQLTSEDVSFQVIKKIFLRILMLLSGLWGELP